MAERDAMASEEDEAEEIICNLAKEGNGLAPGAEEWLIKEVIPDLRADLGSSVRLSEGYKGIGDICEAAARDLARRHGLFFSRLPRGPLGLYRFLIDLYVRLLEPDYYLTHADMANALPYADRWAQEAMRDLDITVPPIGVDRARRMALEHISSAEHTGAGGVVSQQARAFAAPGNGSTTSA